MAIKDAEYKQQLTEFFQHLNTLGRMYDHYVLNYPKELHINPDIIAHMSRIEGFYQRPELGTEVSAHSPIFRYFKLDFGIVLIVEDWEEKFLHFE
jgi:hypothetical protein